VKLAPKLHAMIFVGFEEFVVPWKISRRRELDKHGLIAFSGHGIADDEQFSI
jgi:hypothetical protein